MSPPFLEKKALKLLLRLYSSFLYIFSLNPLTMHCKRAEDLENYILNEIKKHGVDLKKYDNLEEFKKTRVEGYGARRYYEEQNQKTCEKHEADVSIEELADTFNLSIETIRKILYRK